MDQGFPLDDGETEDFAKVEQYLLTSQHMHLKDLQTAHRLIGKEKQRTNHVLNALGDQFIRYTWLKPLIIGPFPKFTYLTSHFIAVQLLTVMVSMNIFAPSTPNVIGKRPPHV